MIKAVLSGMRARRSGRIGDDALKIVGDKIDAMRREISAWEAVSRSTSFG